MYSLLKMGIFHCYVSLPKGRSSKLFRHWNSSHRIWGSAFLQSFGTEKTGAPSWKNQYEKTPGLQHWGFRAVHQFSETTMDTCFYMNLTKLWCFINLRFPWNLGFPLFNHHFGGPFWLVKKRSAKRPSFCESYSLIYSHTLVETWDNSAGWRFERAPSIWGGFCIYPLGSMYDICTYIWLIFVCKCR